MFSTGRSPEWRNRLIWGDKKYVLSALLDEFAGKVDLIYIDPPFDTGADFSFQVQVEGEDFTKQPNMIEQKAYRDTWGVSAEEHGNGKTHVDKYLQWFYETASILQELLAEDGSIFVHIGQNLSHQVKCVLDETFGPDNFRNEIILPGRAIKNLQQQFDTIQRLQVRHDTLFWYSKEATTRFKPYWVTKHDQGNPEGHWHHFWSTADRPTMRYELFGHKPQSGQWVWKEERALKAVENHERFIQEAGGRTLAQYWRDTGCALEFVRPAPDDNRPQYWRAPAEERIGDSVWSGIPIYSNESGYPTEKNLKFLEEVLNLASKESSLVLDCFVGSGTTAVSAEKLNRRWIAADLGRFAIHTTRKRLLEIPNVKPFIVQNLGKYERQLWQAVEFGEKAEDKILTYRKFILELYHAQPITGHTWLHGLKGGRMVHVGAVDSPITPQDITQIAIEFKRIMGTGKNAPTTNGVDVLGWEFAFELNEVAKQHAALANINMRFLRIPREVLEKKAVEQGDIRFFELAALALDVKQNARNVTLTLNDFIIPPDDVPEDIRKAITHWEQWVDYWAVDWNNHEDTFHNEWQDYRTRKKREIQKTISHTYDQPGSYTIMVKVIDILGNDTTKTLKIEVH